MKPPYDIHLLTLIQIIYQRDNVCYFSKKKCNSNHDNCAMKGIKLDKQFVHKNIERIDDMDNLPI
jgi:hypothetical protein